MVGICHIFWSSISLCCCCPCLAGLKLGDYWNPKDSLLMLNYQKHLGSYYLWGHKSWEFHIRMVYVPKVELRFFGKPDGYQRATQGATLQDFGLGQLSLWSCRPVGEREVTSWHRSSNDGWMKCATATHKTFVLRESNDLDDYFHVSLRKHCFLLMVDVNILPPPAVFLVHLLELHRLFWSDGWWSMLGTQRAKVQPWNRYFTESQHLLMQKQRKNVSQLFAC